MIYTDEFVWLHFPKCAGSKIEHLFKTYLSDVPGLHQDVVDPKVDLARVWHDSVADREARDPTFALAGRTVICSIRRLPSWLESRYNFECDRSPHLAHDPRLLLEGKFLERSGFVNHADRYMLKYLPGQLRANAKVRFLRTEYFETDFIEVFGDYLDVSLIPFEELGRKVNASRAHVAPEVGERLRSSREVYQMCPQWRAVELLAYGRI